jgi:peptidoglycan/xylan/chitin deacetylase (PgdA/CDA1 family)
MILRTGIKRSVQWCSYASGASAFWAKRHAFMRIIQFHGVGGDGYPAEVFEAQLGYLKKHLSIITLESLLDKVANEKDAASNDIALTFDDGLRNHYVVVYPILKRLNVPATFFVCPGLIESRQWLWNQEARERLRLLTGERRVGLSRELGAVGNDVEDIVAWLKTLALSPRRSAEAAIREMTPDFKPSSEDQERYGMMTWEEVSSLDPELVSIGAHTVTHPILTTLTSVDLSYEVGEGRRWLEERLQRPIKHFCYPNGAYNEAVVHCVTQCYAAAVTSRKGDVRLKDDLYSLRRVPTTDRLTSLAWRLHQPAGAKDTYRRISNMSA